MNLITRRAFLENLSLVTAALTLPRHGFPLAYHANEFVKIATAYGRTKGGGTEGVNVFKGIPYGGRVSGDRRFRRPAPLESWTGVRDRCR